MTRGVSLTLVALAFLALGSTPSQAHSQLVSSTPANGAVLAVAPTTVAFVFDEPLLPDLDTISINTKAGVNVVSQRVEPVGNTLSITWPATIDPGTYQVAYRIVSGDGHPVTGAILFSFGTPPTPSTSPSATGVTGDYVLVEESASVGTIVSIVALIAAVLSITLIVVLVKRGNSKN
ncbi:MAG: hypothetical protein F2923_07440 [Actinobacteria bacterium]|uniref:Unannotated protein n=1 Tax=freshwater metagenome TaxID=449393 RepID=A0A6J7SL22_9ZZZZ|nr:hypothetical protein [Actinomycetota bacterium]